MQSPPESTALLIHPAHELLALIVIALHVVLPLGTWAMLSGYRDQHARIWLAGVACYSLGFSLSALNTLAYSDTQALFLSIFYMAGIVLMLEALARDLNPSRQHSLKFLGAGVLLGGAYFSFIIRHGFYPTWGLMSLSSLFVLFATTGIFLCAQLIQRHRTRSLYLIVTALVLLMSGHLLRLGMLISGARAESFQVAAFTWNSNYLVFSTVLTMILISFGYWGYVLDKMRKTTSEVQAKQLAAEMLAEESQLLIKERDQLLMVNARVSAISSLSSFSAMLVHDISQPLQALEFGLYDLKAQVTKTSDADHLHTCIVELQNLSTKAGEMVSHLRQLMGRGQDHISPINPDQALQTILPILEGEARQRGIALTYHAHMTESPLVMANAVMLQRIVLNTVGNALDALQQHSGAAKSIEISLYPENHEQDKGMTLKIEDNGPGFESQILSQLNHPIQTSKPNGLGLGLLLMQSMVRMWGGHTRIGNHVARQTTGGLVQIWLSAAPHTKSL